MYAYTSSAIRRGLAAGVVDNLIVIQIAFALIIFYSLMVFGRPHPFRSRTALAVSGIVSVVFAYVEALGLGTYLGLEISQIV